MKTVRMIGYTLAALLAANCGLLVELLELPPVSLIMVFVGAAAMLTLICIRPASGRYATARLRTLDGGATLLRAGLLSETFSAAGTLCTAVLLVPERISVLALLANCVVTLLVTAALFLAGTVRLLRSSVQLGIRWRLALILLWWIPLVNIVLIRKVCRLAREEYRTESTKYELDHARAERAVCCTQYPILLVHGVFFRDSRFLNYWGRIPAELIRNGATIYYGEQQSASSVADSARELKARIESIVKSSGCGKVNIIAHSKGGLDARYAVSCLDAARYVASLTTINTPHRGCIFAEYLLEKTSDKFQQGVAETYNSALRKLGDSNPDFLAAVRDLTQSACTELNASAPDVPGVLYESVGSKVRRAKGGQFPLNVSYPLVRRFDGENDGLVAVDSARWGSRFTLLTPRGRRGISHEDMIDLERVNLPGFDVREFYVKLVESLRSRGY